MNKDLSQFAMSKKQMNQVVGGSDYCEALQQMTRGEECHDWTEEEWDAWAEAWETHCAN